MIVYRFLFVFVGVMTISHSFCQEEGSLDTWEKVERWIDHCKKKETPPPFEKIYVKPNDLLSTPYGCYYINEWGEKEKVCAVLSDCGGCYAIKISRQCPVCGRWCDDNKAPEGYDCPFGKIEVLPNLWSEP